MCAFPLKLSHPDCYLFRASQ